MKVDFRLKIFSLNRQIFISVNFIRYAIIFIVVLISTVAAYWGTRIILVSVVGLAVGIAGFFMLLRYPSSGFILLFLGSMFVPFTGPGGFNTSMLILIMMVVLWLMDMFVVKRKFAFIVSRPIRPAFYMLIVSVIAFAMGQIPLFVFAKQAPLDAQIGGFAIYFFLITAMIMTANILKDIKWLKAIVWIYIFLGSIYVLGRALHLSIVDQLYQHGVNSNSMFWMWLVTLPLSQAIFNDHLKPRFRIFLYLLVALTFYVSVVQAGDWKSGWVPSAVVAGVLLALRFKRFIPFAIPFALIAVVFLAKDLISTDQYSWGTRVDAWLVVLDISKTSPIIGLGFANYYWYAKVFTIRGYHIRFNSHSQFVDIIAQTGILGFACFMWILFEIGRLAWKLMDQLPAGFAKAYAYGIFASVFGSLMAAFLVDWLLPFAYNIGLDGVRASVLPWIFFGGLISIEQMYLAEQKNNSPANLKREHRLRPIKA